MSIVVRARPAWQRQAACRDADTDLFFSDQPAERAEATAICRECPVRKPCLTWAIEHHEDHGIWGGTSERERRRIRARLPKKLAATSTSERTSSGTAG